jgi:hypothetical protein
LFGGPGNDKISAVDGQVGRVNCGTGIDTAYVDDGDIINPAQAQICEYIFVTQQAS